MRLFTTMQRFTMSAIAGGTIGCSLYYPNIVQNHISAEPNLSIAGSLTQKLIGLSRFGGAKKENKLIEEAIKDNVEIKKDVYGDHYKHWDDNNLNYVFVGASGTGKSTFANTFCGKRYKFKTGFIETTHVEDISCDVFAESGDDGPKIVFWDIPGFGTEEYKPKEYFKKFGLTRFDGILLMTSTRFTDRDKRFYQVMRDRLLELFKKMKAPPIEHVPVYIVRTKFDADLESVLKKRYFDREEKATLYENIMHFLLGKSKFTHDEFMEIWNETLMELENQAKKQFYDVFKDDEKFMSYFYIVSSDWNNRGLTTYKNYSNDLLTQTNKRGGEEFGWHGIWRRILKDTVYFNGKGIQNDTIKTQIDTECKERYLEEKAQVIESVLYKEYTSRVGGINMAKITAFGLYGASILAAYGYGAYLHTPAPAPAVGAGAVAQRDWKWVAGQLLMGGVMMSGLVYQQRIIQNDRETIERQRRQLKKSLQSPK